MLEANDKVHSGDCLRWFESQEIIWSFALRKSLICKHLEPHPVQCPSHLLHCCLHSGPQELPLAWRLVHLAVSLLRGILLLCQANFTQPEDFSLKSLPQGSLSLPSHSPPWGRFSFYMPKSVSIFLLPHFTPHMTVL